jgi:hypothetical protein
MQWKLTGIEVPNKLIPKTIKTAAMWNGRLKSWRFVGSQESSGSTRKLNTSHIDSRQTIHICREEKRKVIDYKDSWDKKKRGKEMCDIVGKGENWKIKNKRERKWKSTNGRAVLVH